MLRAVRRALALSAVLAVAAAAPAPAQDVVGEQDLQPHLGALHAIALESGGHRAAGTPGEARTAEYAAAQLAEAGWTVARTDVPFDYWEERSPPTLGAYRHGTDFVTVHYSGPGDLTARVRAIRGGGCRPRDFRRFPRGRIALVAAYGCTFRRAAVLAQRAGARGMLVADFTAGPPVAATLGRPGLRLPVVSVRLPIAARLARRRPRLRLRVDSITERRVTQNVVAELPGTEPNAVVMAGGHMDSTPRGPGMNDNGSGVAALVAMGRQLAVRPRGRATLRFGFWAAHEPGMYGASRYARDLPREERRRVRAYLNLDMLGSPNGAPEVYTTTRAMRRLLARHLRGAGRTSADAPSDHTAFSRIGIPIGGIYTGSLEPKTRAQRRRWGGTAGKERDACYHRPCDDLDNVDLRMLSITATAARNALEELAR
ncbi:MAG TPA: M28 family peptidase [Solirubrobacteraceae bacterium]|nr:M28 family peptidase [Solirubrobacteraceae bacterium]